MMRLQIDVPLSQAPPIEQAACVVFFVDRHCKLGLKILRKVLGRSLVKGALATSGRWLIGVRSKASACVCTLATEAELLEAHRDLLQLYGRGHVEVFHWLEPDLRKRVVADSQQHALRLAPAAGCA